jgi:hypothetical protein
VLLLQNDSINNALRKELENTEYMATVRLVCPSFAKGIPTYLSLPPTEGEKSHTKHLLSCSNCVEADIDSFEINERYATG